MEGVLVSGWARSQACALHQLVILIFGGVEQSRERRSSTYTRLRLDMGD